MPKILIVEDEQPVASMLTESVAEGGWALAGPARTIGEATDLLEADEIDAAVLDLIVSGEYVYPLAHKLRTRGIPFAITTGLGPEIDAQFGDAPVITKPFQTEHVTDIVREMVADR